jgi:hypothetical protein
MLYVMLHRLLRIYFFICTYRAIILFAFFVSVQLLLRAMGYNDVEVVLDSKQASLEFKML